MFEPALPPRRSSSSSSAYSASSSRAADLPSYLRVTRDEPPPPLVRPHSASGGAPEAPEAAEIAAEPFAKLLFLVGMRAAPKSSWPAFNVLAACWPPVLLFLLLARVARDVAAAVTEEDDAKGEYAAWALASLVPLLCQAGGWVLVSRLRVIEEAASSLAYLNASLTSSRRRAVQIKRKFHRYLGTVGRLHARGALAIIGVPWLVYNARRLAGQPTGLDTAGDRRMLDALGAAYPVLFALSDLVFFLAPTTIMVVASFVMHLLRRRVKRMRDTVRSITNTDDDEERRLGLSWMRTHALATTTADKWLLAGSTFGTSATLCVWFERAFYRLCCCRGEDRRGRGASGPVWSRRRLPSDEDEEEEYDGMEQSRSGGRREESLRRRLGSGDPHGDMLVVMAEMEMHEEEDDRVLFDSSAEYAEHLRDTFMGSVREGDKLLDRMRRRFRRVLLPSVALWVMWTAGLAATLAATAGRRPALDSFVAVTFLPLILLSLLRAIQAKYWRHRRKLVAELSVGVHEASGGGTAADLTAAEKTWLERNQTVTLGLFMRTSSINLGAIAAVYSSILVYTAASLAVTLPLLVARLHVEFPPCVELCGRRRLSFAAGGGMGYSSTCSAATNVARVADSAVFSFGALALLSYAQLRAVCGHVPTAHLRRPYAAALLVGVPAVAGLHAAAGPDAEPVWVIVPQLAYVAALYVYGALSLAPRVVGPRGAPSPPFARVFLAVTLSPLAVHLLVFFVVVPLYLDAGERARSLIAVLFPSCIALLVVALSRLTAAIRSPQELLLLRKAKLSDFSPDPYWVGGNPLVDPRALERKSSPSLSGRRGRRALSTVGEDNEPGDELESLSGGHGLLEPLVGAEAAGAAAAGAVGAVTVEAVIADQRRQLGGEILNERADVLYLGPLSRVVLLLCAKAWLEMYARFFLTSLSSLSEQAVAVALFSAAEVAWRTLAPDGRYALERARALFRGGSASAARERAEEERAAYRSSVFNARMVAGGMLVSLYCIVFALAATFIIGRHFEESDFEAHRMSARFFWGSLGLQLVGAVVTDLVAIKLETSYLERPILNEWHVSKRSFFLVVFPLFVLAVLLFLPEYVLLAIEPKPCR